VNTDKLIAQELIAPVLGLVLASTGLAQQEAVVLKGATIYPVSGSAIQNGVVILTGGKIKAIGGADTAMPDGARVIDVTGKIITPGLIDAGTTLSVSPQDANEQAEEVTPQMRIVDAIDPNHKVFEAVRRHGVTTVQINPGNRNVIGGLGAVLKTQGATVDEMLVKDNSALRMAMGAEPSRGNSAIRWGTPVGIYYRRPTTRMGVVWVARKAFYDAMSYRQERTIADPAKTPPEDPGMEVLLQVLDGKLQVHTTARAEQDIRTALRLADEFGYKTVIEGAVEAYRCVDIVAEHNAKVIFSPPSTNGANNPDGAEGRYNTLTLLAKAGVPFAIQTESRLGERQLVYEAMVAMRNGLSFDKALAAVTLTPAQVLGIETRVGSLDPGKDADIVVWSNKPFEPTSTVERLFINGREVIKP
jgi:imidazolonepropionase-like amidohydrolase